MCDKCPVEREKEYLRVSFPERLKQLREAIGISQGAFAKALGVSRAAIGYYESGERMPDIAFLGAVSSLTDCDVYFLLGCSDNMVQTSDGMFSKYELTDNHLFNLNELLSSDIFKYVLLDEKFSCLFSELENYALLSELGGDKIARDIVEYKTIATIGRIIGDAYLNSRSKHDREKWDAKSQEERDAIIREFEEINKEYTQDEQKRKARTQILIDKYHAETEKEAENDPIKRFRLKLFNISIKDEKKTNAQDTN